MEFDPRLTTWLAETCDQSHCYAETGRPGHPVDLTSDPFKARRFATRYQCLTFCTGNYARTFLPPLRPVEHVFVPDSPR